MARPPEIEWHYGNGHGLKGTRIVLQARKLSGRAVVPRSGRHKAQQIVGTENAEAWIEVPLRAVAERKGPRNRG